MPLKSPGSKKFLSFDLESVHETVSSAGRHTRSTGQPWPHGLSLSLSPLGQQWKVAYWEEPQLKPHVLSQLIESRHDSSARSGKLVDVPGETLKWKEHD